MHLTHPEILTHLVDAIRARRRVLLVGPPGVGKTGLVLQAGREFGLGEGAMVVLSAPLIDPFTDLVGIPVPSVDDRSILTWSRPSYIYTAEVILLDEITRAPAKVVNAVLELVQFGSLAGERLPRLRTVFVAGNEPGEGLYAEPFEPALVDRIDTIVHVPNEPDVTYFGTQFPGSIADALIGWWTEDLSTEQQRAVSPRRLEKVGKIMLAGLHPALADTSAVTGARVQIPWEMLRHRIAGGPALDIADFVAHPDRYAALVEQDNAVASRFLMLLPKMNRKDLYAVHMVVMSLPQDALAAIAKREKKLWRRIVMAIGHWGAKGDEKAFEECIEERLSGG